MVRERRRLAAIVCADVVGFSRLVGMDEAGTLAGLKTLRGEVIDPKISENGGRLVKTTGDGLLVEFSSVVDAVRWAVAVQEEMARRDAGLPSDGRIQFRVGVHMGDIAVDGDDILGDGVNVAARLEGLAEPGGICVSGRVHEDLAGKVDLDLRDGGEQSLKNIARPVRVWHWSPAGGTALRPTVPPPSLGDPPFVLRDKPSIIVLPWTCLGGTHEQEAFTDGITESLTTDLSRQGSFLVTASTTALAFKGKAIDVRRLSRELGVRYVLEGTVQCGTRRARINVQLIGASDGAHLWADRFDKELGDLLDLQDEIAERVSRALAVQLREAEIRRAEEAPESASDPTLLIQLGRRTFLRGGSRANCMRAATLFAEALRLDPRNVMAAAMLAIMKAAGHMLRWSETADKDLAEAIEVAQLAMTLDPQAPFAQAASAWVLFAQRKHAAAVAAFERVARGNPTAGGNAFANLANAKNYVGRSEEAIADLLRVIRVTPDDPQMDWWHLYLGAAYAFQGRYQEAADTHRQGIALNPNFDWMYVWLAASSVQLGRLAEAREAIDHARRLGSDWTVSKLKEGPNSGFGIGNDERMSAFWDGLLRAGLPE